MPNGVASKRSVRAGSFAHSDLCRPVGGGHPGAETDRCAVRCVGAAQEDLEWAGGRSGTSCVRDRGRVHAVPIDARTGRVFRTRILRVRR